MVLNVEARPLSNRREHWDGAWGGKRKGGKSDSDTSKNKWNHYHPVWRARLTMGRADLRGQSPKSLWVLPSQWARTMTIPLAMMRRHLELCIQYAFLSEHELFFWKTVKRRRKLKNKKRKRKREGAQKGKIKRQLSKAGLREDRPPAGRDQGRRMKERGCEEIKNEYVNEGVRQYIKKE